MNKINLPSLYKNLRHVMSYLCTMPTGEKIFIKIKIEGSLFI